MNRHTIIIGGDRYLVELVDEKIVSTKKFRVFRNNTIMNDVSIDTDIYFVDSNIDVYNDEIIWPQSELSTVPLMSLDSSTFNEYFTSKDNIYFAYTNGQIIDEEIYEKNVRTQKIRIWHPTTSINKDMILYVDSWINSLHLHWFCKKLSNCKISTEKEVRLNQDIYNEYFEVEIPDFKDILYGNTFIADSSPIETEVDDEEYKKLLENNLKYVKIKEEQETSIHNIYEKPIGKELKIPENGCYQYKSLMLYLYQWIYSRNNKIQYLPKTIATPQINLNITLYPWSSISDNTFLLDNDNLPSSCTFNEEMKFSIIPSIEFVNNTISIVGKFDYNNMYLNISDAWQKVNGTNFLNYKTISEKLSKDKELLEQFGGHSEMVKYTCIVSSDPTIKNIIHVETAYSDKVDEFMFPIKDLFSKWTQVPENVYIKLIVEDRAIGKGCLSPVMLITKDKLRYTINNANYTRLNIKNRETNIENMNTDNFNFINTINCRVVKKSENNVVGTKSFNSPRMIYKPIFFRTQDLQSIRLRSNLKQNIGISLSEYMTKVNEFVLRIEENNIHEIARNGSFVIFSINAKDIKSTTGKYDILTIDNDYISTGNYTIE